MSTKKNKSIRNSKTRNRTSRIETLEDRRLLVSDRINLNHPEDVNNDLSVSPIDALIVINHLNRVEPRGPLGTKAALDPFIDTNGDGLVSPIDALRVINKLNSFSASGNVGRVTPRIEGESASAPIGFLSIPVTQLPGQAGQVVPLSTSLNIGREEFNEMGIFVADDASGRVSGIAPGQFGYAEAVFSSSSRKVLYSRFNTFRTSQDAIMPAGSFAHVYVLQGMSNNSDPNQHLRARQVSTNRLEIGWEEHVSPFNGWPTVGDRGFDDATVDFQIGQPVEGNQEPTIDEIANQVVNEGATITISPTVRDSDLPNEVISFRLDLAPPGATIDSATGRVTWTPTESQGPGNFEFVVRATDSKGSFDTESFFVTVQEINRSPVLQDIASVSVAAGESIAFVAKASDPDLPSNSLRFSLQGSIPSGARIDPLTGEFSWTTTTATAAGDYSFTVRVEDQGSPILFDTKMVTVTVRPVACSFGIVGSAIDTSESGGSAGGKGSVTINNCVATLVEGDSFNVTLSQAFTVPASPSAIQFRYQNLAFDSQDMGFINDAFEVALIDVDGNSLVAPHQIGKDSYFNATERTSVQRASGIQVNGDTVTVGLNGLPVGTAGRIVFRLINNDDDRSTSVQLSDLSIVSSSLLAAPANAKSSSVLRTVQTTSSVGERLQAFNARGKLTVSSVIVNPPVAPRISVTAPDTQVPANTEVLLHGTTASFGQQQNGEPNRTVSVTINGRPVDVLDGSGNFFVKAEVRLGNNEYQFTALDALGQQTTIQLTVAGIDPNSSILDLTQFSDVSGSFTEQYFRTSFNEAARLLQVELGARNDGNFTANAPLLVVVKGISDPSVSLIGYDGLTSDGNPYYDYTDNIANGKLAPGESSSSPTIQFYNPQGLKFDYELSFYGKVNSEPSFSSVPNVELGDGQTYRYDVNAIDPDSNDLRFSLIVSPYGMTIDSATGVITWPPNVTQPGNHNVIVRVEDGQGGFSEQEFTITLLATQPNRPPVITSFPRTDANVGSGGQQERMRLFPTGVDDNFVTIEAGLPDPHYFIVETGSNAIVTDGSLAWTPNDQNSKWIWQQIDLRPTDVTRTFRTQFNLGEFDPSGFVIEGRWSVDNLGIEILVNGIPTGNSLLDPSLSNFQQDWPFYLNSGFKQGVNTIDFIANDFGGIAGFRVTEMSGFNAIVEGLYSYTVQATDLDRDLLRFTLLDSPTGMEIGPQSGTIAWRPTASQLGNHSVRVEVSDGRGGVAIQEFVVCVHSAVSQNPPADSNTPPELFATFPAQVSPGRPISVPIRVADAEREFITLALTSNSPGILTEIGSTGPSGEKLQSSYLYTYTPTQADLAVGSLQVTLTASDGTSQSTTTFSSAVVSSSTNFAPVITSTPRTLAYAGTTYNYQVKASDSDGDLLSYTLHNAPTGMTISTTGFVSWTPANFVSAPQLVTVQVSDQRGGIVTQDYAIRFATQLENSTPQIISNPVLHALEGSLYEYNATVLEREGDPVVWTLVQAPRGMSIDSFSGAIRWRPDAGQLGRSTVHLRATDPYGATDNQVYTIEVSCVNSPPIITSSPRTQAVVGRSYFYGVIARDLENSDLQFSLDSAPLGMTISSAGLIRWIPNIDALNQPNSVVVRVSDSSGASVSQAFNIQVDESNNINRPPEIISTPVLTGAVGRAYEYLLIANDPDGDAVQFQAISSPGDVRFSVNGSSLLLTWTPSVAGDYPISIEVIDPSGARVTQSFILQIQDNNAPRITSSPVTSVLAGTVYRYTVGAEDVDGDQLAYELANQPNGMTIDSLGRILWNVPAVYSEANPTTVQVVVRDAFGGVDSQSFALSIIPDVDPPVVLIQTRTRTLSFDTDTSVDLYSVSSIRVMATDNVAVSQLIVTANGQPIALDAAGAARLDTSTLGEIVLVATARDAAGNVGTKTNRIQVIPPGGLEQPSPNDPTLPPNPGADSTDQTEPIVTITSPFIGDTVTSTVSVIGTIDDPEDNLWYWRAYVGRLDLVDVNNLTDKNPNLVQIGQGTNEVLNAEILRFDPTRFDNDGYAILIAAYDANGRGYIGATEINIEGNAKLGHFRIELTDLAVPLAGIPIQVSRVYDSRNSGREGDFGFGWNMGVQDARILEVGAVAIGGALTGIQSDFIANRTKVYLTNPSGQRVGFTYKEEIISGSFFGGIYRPYFVPDPGVYDTLTIDQTEVARGGLIGSLAGALNPDKYTLTTKDGTVYRYDQFTGVEKITDRSGQTVTFTESGIRHSSGTSIQFVRDFRDRIVQVVDPDGNKILYEYNASGELIKVTNQVNLSSTYNYLATPKHYLDEGFDARGLRDFKVTYDNEGRFVAIIDALGNAVSQQNYDEVANRRAKVLDANGNETQLLYDSRGNVLEEIDAAGNKTIRRYEDPLNPDLETTIIDRRGMVTKRAYDARGNVRTITELGSQSAPLSSPIVTEFTYNANNDVTSIKNSVGALTLFSYDSKGNLSSITNALGNTTSFTYDEQGRRKTYTDSNGNSTTFEYDGGCPCGSPHKSINADGTYQTFEYNQFGQVTLERTFEANGTLVEQKQSFYDAAGRIAREILGAGSDPLQPPTEVRKFYSGNLLDWEIVVHPNSVNPDGSLMESPATPISQRLSRITDYDYDNADRLIRQTDAMGGIVNFRYDAQGNRILLQDPVGNITTWTYDSLNRVFEERDPLYWSALRTNNPNLASLTNAQLLERIAPVVRSAGDDPLYDDPSGASLATNQGAAHVRSFAYDAEGNQAKVIDRNNRRREFSYDYAGRLLQERWYAANNGPLVETIQFAYDTLGNLVTAENAVSKYTYTYDVLKRLKSVDNQDSNSDTPRVILFYEYDAQGNVIKTYDDAGVTVESTYSSLNQLQTRKWYDAVIPVGATADVADARVDFSYNAAGRQKQIRRYSDLSAAAKVGSTDYTYDLSGRTNVLIHKNAVDALLSSYDYNYDFSGLLTSEIRDHQDNSYDDNITYGYDLTGQLVDALFAGQDDENYVYDLNGNRRSSTVGPESRTYVSAPGNQLLSDGVFTYSYDGEGNQKTKTRISDGQITENFWDHQNRLVKVEERSAGGVVTKVVEFAYDNQGRRIVEKVNGATKLQVVYDGDHTWGDYNAAGEAEIRYLFSNNIDQIIAANRRISSTVWYNADKLGTVRGFSNAFGLLDTSIIYTAVGRIASDLSVNSWNRFTFHGREWQASIGEFYVRARYYSPLIGRMLTLDPIMFDGGDANLYRMAFNSQTNLTDPFGLSAESSILQRIQTANKAAIDCFGKNIATEIAAAGIYVFLVSGVPYVGRSVDINRRLKEHRKIFGDQLKVIGTIFEKNPATQRRLEQFFIDEFDSLSRGINARREINLKKWSKIKATLC